MNSATKVAQLRLEQVTPSYCRVVLDHPPLNLMGPEFVSQIRESVTALENDDRVKVVVFESAVDGFFLNHSDFLANFEDLTSIPQGPTGLEAWPDVLVRLTRANTKRLVNEASLPPDVEIREGWDACMASVKRPAAHERINALLEQGLQEPGNLQDRLGFHLGQLGLEDKR